MDLPLSSKQAKACGTCTLILPLSTCFTLNIYLGSVNCNLRPETFEKANANIAKAWDIQYGIRKVLRNSNAWASQPRLWIRVTFDLGK